MSDVVRMKLLEADHPIGIKKKCPYPLPPLDHVYGLPYKKDTEGVAIRIFFPLYNTVTHSWQIHQPSPIAKAQKEALSRKEGQVIGATP